MLRFAPRTPWEYFDAFPPPYCRLLAKEPGGGTADMAVTDAEVAIRSGLSIDRIREISQLESWSVVPTGEMRAFLIGCNFDPTNALDRERVTRYEKLCTKRQTAPFLYLRRSPKWETEFRPIFVLVFRIMTERGGIIPAGITATASPARS